ncbi:adenosylcobyric acid synthase [Symbiobacterium terraclitae]|uniref:Cobyric acid synthase n=1 Tax=Symbiobacterium terraclitae TaxID=557451 RepID=A0ABS4JU87_9FIRM|nr:cobyric acid synthase [Symbiobacterium terraclitae]MBP2018436.1 adenosylcobyric acid synthase [Symbiobacterium terraclitae]
MARALMFQGTASSVGKSTLAAAFCRILRQEGLRVAPFKAQNMSGSAAVLADGRRISVVQAVQAQAAGVAPRVEMNPVLLLPRTEVSSEVVLMGRSLGEMGWRQYTGEPHAAALQAVQEAIASLSAEFEVIVAEGAGSPVEVNLRDRDLANMTTAELLDADVILVADIDRGGVFAAIVGTLALLRPHERARVKGLVINRFRGDPTLFADGVRWLEERTGLPVVGVIPYLPDLGLDEEDSLGLSGPGAAAPTAGAREAALERLADHVRRHARVDLVLEVLNRAG